MRTVADVETRAVGRALAELRRWFAGRGWRPHAFQERAWRAFRAGRSGLIHVPTGAGKTYAATLAALAEVRAAGRPGLQVIHVTPLRAVARDVERALRRPVADLGWDLEVGLRTGDVAASRRAALRRRPPHVLVTTPESLALMLAHEDTVEQLRGLRALVLDEWHELLGDKRGSLLELSAARLRRLAPGLRTWALSATLANLDEAAACAVGTDDEAMVVRARLPRPVTVRTLLPADVEAFPWAGHLGMQMLPRLVDWLDPRRSTLVFTNTRSQAELWHDAILRARPDWFEHTALHHGSLDREVRAEVEARLADGRIRLVVATSSLDLGVDFGPVERVVQIGSPRGIARLVQRAGRAAHQPGATAEILLVPTHAMELVEATAARDALARGEVEARRPLAAPLDVLAQHMVTVGVGGGFDADELLAEVRSATSYRDVDEGEFRWLLDLLAGGGAALGRYPDFHRLRRQVDGRFALRDRRKATLHRLNVGTISSDAAVELRYLQGARLGQVEESFVGRLRPGERFLFAGRLLEVVERDDAEVRVRRARGTTRHTPRWMGGRLPMSSMLGAAVRRLLGEVARGRRDVAELRAVAPVLDMQARLSHVPGPDELLVESWRGREGAHLFVFPFEGRLVHEGLAALLAVRLGRLAAGSFSLAVDDCGLLVQAADPAYPFEEAFARGGGPAALFAEAGLVDDIAETLDVAGLARRQFRDVARVAGLVQQTRPGQQRTMRSLQTSAGLLFDVFERHDPDNLLVGQARREVLTRHFEHARLLGAMARLRAARLRLVATSRPSPMAFPLVVEKVRARVSSEGLAERIARMQAAFDAEAARRQG